MHYSCGTAGNTSPYYALEVLRLQSVLEFLTDKRLHGLKALDYLLGSRCRSLSGGMSSIPYRYFFS